MEASKKKLVLIDYVDDNELDRHWNKTSEIIVNTINKNIESIFKAQNKFDHFVLKRELTKFDYWLIYSFNLNWFIMKYIIWKYKLIRLSESNDLYKHGIEIRGDQFWCKLVPSGENYDFEEVKDIYG